MIMSHIPDHMNSSQHSDFSQTLYKVEQVSFKRIMLTDELNNISTQVMSLHEIVLIQ